MRLALVSPATVIDLAECFDRCHPIAWMAGREQLKNGDSFAWRSEDGRALACGGFYNIQAEGEGGIVDCWLALTSEAAPHMPQILADTRLTMRAGGYGSLRVLVSTKAGRVIARRLGFSPGGGFEGMELWAWNASRGSSD